MMMATLRHLDQLLHTVERGRALNVDESGRLPVRLYGPDGQPLFTEQNPAHVKGEVTLTGQSVERMIMALETMAGFHLPIYDAGKEYMLMTEGYSYREPVVRKEDGYLYLFAESNDGTAVATFVTDVSVDISRFNRLFIDWENTGHSSPVNESYFIVSANKMGSHDIYDAKIERTNRFERTVSVLDVSGITGEVYIRVHARDGSSTSPRNSEIRVYRIWGSV